MSKDFKSITGDIQRCDDRPAQAHKGFGAMSKAATQPRVFLTKRAK